GCRQGVAAPIQVAADGRVGLETDGAIERGAGAVAVADAPEQFRPRGPVWLILRDPAVAGDFFDGGHTSGRPECLGDGDGSIDGNHWRSGHCEEYVVDAFDRLPI